MPCTWSISGSGSTCPNSPACSRSMPWGVRAGICWPLQPAPGARPRSATVCGACPVSADATRPEDGASARHRVRQSRALRWALGVGTAFMTDIGMVLLFLLTLATNNRTLYERNYAWLFGVNVMVALVLLAELVWVTLRLGMRLRKGRFGSRLLPKLAAIFALVGLMPGLLIYVVSYQFVPRSIESWFDVKVEGALSAGVRLAPASLDSLAADMVAKTRNAATQLAQVPDAAAGLALERLRDQIGATDMVLWNAAG